MLPLVKFNLFNIGISGAANKAEANRIRLTNMIAMVPLIIYISSTVFSLYANYPRIVIVNSIGILATIVALLLNYKYQYAIAKSIIICTHAATILVYYKLMMDEPSMFFYYFPIILTLIIFYNPEKEKMLLRGTLTFVVICILLTLFLPNAVFRPFPLSATLHAVMFVINAFICIFLSTLYVLKMFRVNIRNERLLTEAKLAAEQAALAKAVFLSNMSHELRTPLNGIIGTTHILKSETFLPGQEYHLSVMSNLSQHMLGLVNNVLDYSKIDAGKLELDAYRFNLKDFLHKTDLTFRQLFDEKAITYKIDADERIGAFDVFADELRLQQIMNNLISNALKFTGKNGTVTVSVSIVKKEADKVRLLFSVSDNGIGIAAHHQVKIFDSFSQGDSATTRMYGGSGLGLSISNSLVKQFKGTLHLNSEKGKGSNFYFDITLPLHNQQKAIVKENQILSAENLKNFRVLIAEDNKINMIVARKIMQRWGIQITEAENGQIAYDKCVTADFDLILLDLEMPVMDGKTALKKINALNKGIPVIAFTAGVYENMKTDLFNIGFTDYLLKPFMPEDLYRKIIAAGKNNS
jgi:signal transduction histidine kinase/ActR/RegA family two-component response regulator